MSFLQFLWFFVRGPSHAQEKKPKPIAELPEQAKAESEVLFVDLCTRSAGKAEFAASSREKTELIERRSVLRFNRTQLLKIANHRERSRALAKLDDELLMVENKLDDLRIQSRYSMSGARWKEQYHAICSIPGVKQCMVVGDRVIVTTHNLYTYVPLINGVGRWHKIGKKRVTVWVGTSEVRQLSQGIPVCWGKDEDDGVWDVAPQIGDSGLVSCLGTYKDILHNAYTNGQLDVMFAAAIRVLECAPPQRDLSAWPTVKKYEVPRWYFDPRMQWRK